MPNKEYYQSHKIKLSADAKEYYKAHREHSLAYTVDYYQAHKALKCSYQKTYREKLKRLTLTHYGNGKCACIKCGFSDIRALSIDHINGNGTHQHEGITAGTPSGTNTAGAATSIVQPYIVCYFWKRTA